MGAVTYFVQMVAKPGQAEAVQELLLTNPRRIEQGEPGNLAFGVPVASSFTVTHGQQRSMSPWPDLRHRPSIWPRRRDRTRLPSS